MTVHNSIVKLRGLRHLMDLDLRRVTTPEQLNAHIDHVVKAVNTLRIESAAPEPEPTRQEPEIGHDRMERSPKRTRKKADKADKPDEATEESNS